MINRKNRPESGESRESGFTLIEVALAMIVISIIGVMFIREYRQHVEELKFSNTDDSLGDINTALQRYASMFTSTVPVESIDGYTFKPNRFFK